jgi:hypothetical protein
MMMGSTTQPTGMNEKGSGTSTGSYTFGSQPVPFVSQLGPNIGYFYYQSGMGQQNCHTPTSVQQPMFPATVPQAQLASTPGSSFLVPGSYGYMPNVFQSQANMLPKAFHTMTPQDPSWNMDTGASSHLADNTGILTIVSNSCIYPSVYVGNGESIPVTHTGHSLLHTSTKPYASNSTDTSLSRVNLRTEIKFLIM